MTEKSNSQPTDEPSRVDDSPEFDQVLDSFEKTESARRRKGLIYTLIGLMIAGGLFLLTFVFRTEVFGPPVDVDEGEEEILAKTDDPQCRDMIAQVQDLSERYFKLEPAIEDDLLGDDPEAIQAIVDEVARLQQRLDEIEEDSREANLRFDESRQELDEWFDYVELELSFVDRLAKERLDELKARADDQADDDQADADEADADEADDAQEGVVVEEGDESPEEEEEQAANQMTPPERRDGAMVAIHDAFQKFRVWHSSSAHPCGAADEGEEPWRPDDA